MSGTHIYTFHVEILGSRNPTVTRTFTLPASSTFQGLHHAIQYTFGWNGSQPHAFTFEPTRTHRVDGFLLPRTVLMDIGMGDAEEYGVYGAGDERPYFDEKDIKLSDVWEENGKARKGAMRGGNMASLFYMYGYEVRSKLTESHDINTETDVISGQLGSQN